jgi:hypothetical protein
MPRGAPRASGGEQAPKAKTPPAREPEGSHVQRERAYRGTATIRLVAVSVPATSCAK